MHSCRIWGNVQLWFQLSSALPLSEYITADVPSRKPLIIFILIMYGNIEGHVIMHSCCTALVPMLKCAPPQLIHSADISVSTPQTHIYFYYVGKEIRSRYPIHILFDCEFLFSVPMASMSRQDDASILSTQQSFIFIK